MLAIEGVADYTRPFPLASSDPLHTALFGGTLEETRKVTGWICDILEDLDAGRFLSDPDPVRRARPTA